jgi:hypothetical protein
MKKQLLTIFLSLSAITITTAQTWSKISGIADSTEIKQIASINNQLVIAGQNWFSNTTTDFYSSVDGNSWAKIPTYSFAGIYVWGLPQNNLLLSSSLVGSKKLNSNNWAAFNTSGFGYAEFANGTIIGGNANAPGQLSTVSPAGVVGSTIGVTYKMGPKYCKASNNRVFLFSYGYGMAYIDHSNLSALVYPATLNSNTMTASSWTTYNIIDMIQTSNGNLIAVDGLGYGIMRSTDNGVNWNFVNTTIGGGLSIVKNSSDNVFVIAGNKVWQSLDFGSTFTDISGNLPGFKKVQLFMNANNELFCFNNGNNFQSAISGIYKLGTANSINENRKEEVFSFYPNPNSGNFNLKVDEEMVNAAITITDIFGSVIYTCVVRSKDINISENFKTGVYFITIQNEKFASVKKMIVN